jgi:hypothetical protein
MAFKEMGWEFVAGFMAQESVKKWAVTYTVMNLWI